MTDEVRRRYSPVLSCVDVEKPYVLSDADVQSLIMGVVRLVKRHGTRAQSELFFKSLGEIAMTLCEGD